jgi:hypothetical protein
MIPSVIQDKGAISAIVLQQGNDSLVSAAACNMKWRISIRVFGISVGTIF